MFGWCNQIYQLFNLDIRNFQIKNSASHRLSASFLLFTAFVTVCTSRAVHGQYTRVVRDKALSNLVLRSVPFRTNNRTPTQADKSGPVPAEPRRKPPPGRVGVVRLQALPRRGERAYGARPVCAHQRMHAMAILSLCGAQQGWGP